MSSKVFLLRNSKQHDGGYKNFENIKEVLGADADAHLIERGTFFTYRTFISTAIRNPKSRYIINQSFLCLLVYLSSFGRARIAFIIDSIDNNYPVSKLSRLKSIIIKCVNIILFSRKNIFTIAETKYLAKLINRYKIVNDVMVLNTPSPSINREGVRKCGNPVRLLYVGRISQEKGVEHLLDFALYAKSKGLNYVFDLIGSGDLECMFEQLNLDNVNLLGWKSAKEVSSEYKKGGIFLHLPIKDAFPTSIREAMSYGLPVISLRKQGIPELVTNEVNGLLLEEYQPTSINHAVSRVIHDYDRFSSCAYKAASLNDMQTYKNKLINILTDSEILEAKSEV